MAMMGIGVMRMAMGHGLVAVAVRMLPFNRRHMPMRVVFIVRMQVLVFQRLMPVCMRMVFGQMQPYPKAHQGGSSQQLPGDGPVSYTHLTLPTIYSV